MKKTKRYPLNPGEMSVLKATIYDLSELAAKQVLYAIIQGLCLKTNLNINQFQEIIDDARKLTAATKTN